MTGIPPAARADRKESRNSPPDRGWNLRICRRRTLCRSALALTGLLTASAVFLLTAEAATLRSTTVQAWDRYYRWADERVMREVKNPGRFLILDLLSPADRAEARRRLGAGETYIARMIGVVPASDAFRVPDGEIHHWWGAVLVPGVRLPELMRFLKDYDHHAGKFADVVGSHLIKRDGDRFTFQFRLMRSKAFVTAYYNTVQEATYYTVDARHVWSKSVATRIAELENPGTPQEKEIPPGEDRGFLWRLVSWWRFQETDQGVIVEIESASLSRDIPTFVKWIPGVSSYIRTTPRESLESVLLSIRSQFPTPRK